MTVGSTTKRSGEHWIDDRRPPSKKLAIAARALQSICAAMVEEGWADSHVEHDIGRVTLTITFSPEVAFYYELDAKSRPLPASTALDAPINRRSLT